jgi:hypothetical protein
VSAARILGGDGADSFSFGSTISNATLHAGNGNDSLSLAGNMTGFYVSLDEGSDLAIFASSFSSGTVLGGSGGDSLIFNASVGTGSTIDAGADNDSVYFLQALSSTSVYGGAGNDTLSFASAVDAATIDAGYGVDNLQFASSFSGHIKGAGSNSENVNFGSTTAVVFDEAIGSGSTIQFSNSADLATFAGAVGASTILGGAGNDTLMFFDAVNGASLDAGGGSDALYIGSFTGRISGLNSANEYAIFASTARVGFESDIGSGSTIIFSPLADLATFSGTVGAAKINGAYGNDTLVFTNILAGASLYGGSIQTPVFLTDEDQFLGTVTIGTGGVSFWGGAQNDTFNFTQFTGSIGNTAYFWNDVAGTDSIVFNNIISNGTSGAGAVFGISNGIGSSLDISFAAGQSSSGFNAGSFSSAFLVSGTNLVSFGYGNTQVTLIFEGGSAITLNGGAFESAGGTNIFSNAGNGTANFGITSTIPNFFS